MGGNRSASHLAVRLEGYRSASRPAGNAKVHRSDLSVASGAGDHRSVPRLSFSRTAGEPDVTSYACDVVLLTERPQAHEALIEALRRHGVSIRVARALDRTKRILDWGPELILVDLVHGAGLTHDSVALLNQRRGPMMVALHSGAVEHDLAAAAELTVEGFCRCDAWNPVLDVLASRASARYVN